MDVTTTVRYYGGSAEAAGCAMEHIALGSTPRVLGDLLDHLVQIHPDLAPVLAVSRYFVDQRLAGRETGLPHGVQVDVLPPFAGG